MSIRPISFQSWEHLSRSSKLNFLIFHMNKLRIKEAKWPTGVLTWPQARIGRAPGTSGRDPLMSHRKWGDSPRVLCWRRSTSLAALASLWPASALAYIYSTSPGLDHSIWLLIMHQHLPFPSPFVLTLSNSRESCSTDSIWIQLMKNSVTSILGHLIFGFPPHICPLCPESHKLHFLGADCNFNGKEVAE